MLTGSTDVLSMYTDINDLMSALTFTSTAVGYLEPVTTVTVTETSVLETATLVSSVMTVINAYTESTDLLNGVPPPITGHLLYQAGPLKVMGKL